MKFEKDYYRILEVSPLADAAAIRKAYRHLAHRYHPDKNPDNSFSEARFREVKEAYEVLRQESLRANYDEWRWLTGRAYRKARQMPTPQWLIAQVNALSVQVSQLAPYEIEQRLLYDYLRFLLSDAHSAVLAAGSGEEREEFLNGLATVLPKLRPDYLPEVLERTMLLCGESGSCRMQLLQLQQALKQETRWQQWKPLVLLAIVLLLLLIMYVWTGRR